MGHGSRVSQSEAEKFGLRDLRMAVIWGTCLPEEQMRRLLLSLALGLTAAAPLHAQGLRDIVSDLFIFGDGEQPLFLGGSGNPNNPEWQGELYYCFMLGIIQIRILPAIT